MLVGLALAERTPPCPALDEDDKLTCAVINGEVRCNEPRAPNSKPVANGDVDVLHAEDAHRRYTRVCYSLDSRDPRLLRREVAQTTHEPRHDLVLCCGRAEGHLWSAGGLEE